MVNFTCVPATALDRCLLWPWRAASVVASVSVLLYPIIKSLPQMFLVGACGTAAAIALVIVGAWPLENFVYGGSNAKWLAIVCLIAFVLRSPFLFVRSEEHTSELQSL